MSLNESEVADSLIQSLALPSVVAAVDAGCSPIPDAEHKACPVDAESSNVQLGIRCRRAKATGTWAETHEFVVFLEVELYVAHSRWRSASPKLRNELKILAKMVEPLFVALNFLWRRPSWCQSTPSLTNTESINKPCSSLPPFRLTWVRQYFSHELRKVESTLPRQHQFESFAPAAESNSTSPVTKCQRYFFDMPCAELPSAHAASLLQSHARISQGSLPPATSSAVAGQSNGRKQPMADTFTSNSDCEYQRPTSSTPATDRNHGHLFEFGVTTYTNVFSEAELQLLEQHVLYLDARRRRRGMQTNTSHSTYARQGLNVENASGPNRVNQDRPVVFTPPTIAARSETSKMMSLGDAPFPTIARKDLSPLFASCSWSTPSSSSSPNVGLIASQDSSAVDSDNIGFEEFASRTKYFFGARYLWTAGHRQSEEFRLAGGIRADVDPVPDFIRRLVVPRYSSLPQLWGPSQRSQQTGPTKAGDACAYGVEDEQNLFAAPREANCMSKQQSRSRTTVKTTSIIGTTPTAEDLAAENENQAHFVPLLKPDYVNAAAVNIYHDGREGIAQHFDDASRFCRPIVTLRLFSDSRLTFGGSGFTASNASCVVPMPRGCVTVLEPDSYAANKIKHCVRAADMSARSAVLIVRRIHTQLLHRAERL